MNIFSAFVTGANRGIGLDFVKQLIKLPNPPKFVFATYRSRDGIEVLEEIRDKSKNTQVLLIKMDITKKNEIESARKIVETMVGDKGLTLLINNAGVAAAQKFPNITEENLIYHFKTNTVGPVMVVQEFLPLLQKAAAQSNIDSGLKIRKPAVLNISAALGSIQNCGFFIESAGYNISKAALNMSMRVIAAEIKTQGILLVMMCPGWVKTDMGSDKAELSVEESVGSMLKTLANLDESHHGAFMDRNGNHIPF